ncbi:MAG: hypothetical protein ACU0GG_16160 [Paracoccaceae bacterium]
MSHPDQASVVCKHVMQNFANAGYVTHQGQSWGAGCSKQCLEKSGPTSLNMICLSYFSSVPGLPKDYYTLPSGFAYYRREGHWVLEYDLDEFEPEEGEFIAAPEDHPTRRLSPNDTVYTLMLSDGSYAVLNLAEGTRCISFWLRKQVPEGLRLKLNGSEKLVPVSYSEIESFARENGICFLAPDFLCQPYDLATLVTTQET